MSAPPGKGATVEDWARYIWSLGPHFTLGPGARDLAESMHATFCNASAYWHGEAKAMSDLRLRRAVAHDMDGAEAAERSVAYPCLKAVLFDGAVRGLEQALARDDAERDRRGQGTLFDGEAAS